METMTGLDAKFLYSETPTAHMHTVKVVVADVSALKGGFSFDALTGSSRTNFVGSRRSAVGSCRSRGGSVIPCGSRTPTST